MHSKAYDDRRMRQIASHVTGETLLDIGYAQAPNPYLAGVHRLGYDLNKPAQGSVHYEEEIEGDVRDITGKLHGRTFDTIICAELIEHLENPYSFLRDIGELLAPGGRVILTTPNPLGFPVVICELLRIKRFFYTTEHLHYFLPRWVERILDMTGFKCERLQPVGFWLPFGVIGLCPVALSYQIVYVASKRDNRPQRASADGAGQQEHQGVRAA